MHDIGRLIRVCTSMPGFCDRSRQLSDMARRAIVHAMLKSGQPAPLAAQRYIDFPSLGTTPSYGNNRSNISDAADHQTLNNLPFLQLAGEPTQGLSTTGYSSTPSQRTSAANSGSAQVIDASACTRNTPSNIREETAVNQLQHPGFTAPVHGMPPPASLPVPVPAVSSQRAEIMPTLRPQCYTDNSGASPRLSSGQIEGATSGIADRQTPSFTGTQHGGRMNAEMQTPAWHGTIPDPAAMDQQIAHGQTMQAQWRPYTEQIWPSRTACSGISRNNHPQNGNEDRLSFGSELARATAIDNTTAPTQDHTEERDNGIWDDFIIDDFAGSLRFLQ
jgi:hypothetical protein